MIRLLASGLFACTFAALLAGCNSSPSTGTPAASAEGTNVAASLPAPLPADAAPDQVVASFLDALRHGNKDVTAALLTDRARQETEQNDLVVDPQSVPNAEYQVAGAEILADNPNGAHVSSLWSESYLQDGKLEKVQYEIIWVLRKQANGWRIAGMATQIAPNEPPLFLNFEDAKDLLQKREEMAGPATPPTDPSQPGVQQAQTPAAPGTAERR